MADKSEEPFEGANDTALVIQLGALTVAWPSFELGLFSIFQKLLKCDMKKATIVWFELTSIEVRMRMIQKLVDEPGTVNPEGIKRALKHASELARQRNKFVHGIWDKRDDDGPVMLFNTRKKVKYTITASDVEALVREVHAFAEALFALSKQQT